MTRKDSDKDSERPRYYSQFWLDIAAGRRTIGGPKPEDEGELEDSQEPIALRRPFRSEPEEDLDEVDEPVTRGERPAVLSRPVADEVSPAPSDLGAEADEAPVATDDTDNLAVNDSVEDADIPDFTTDEDDGEETEDAEDAEDADDEDFFDDDEEEEDDGWVAGRGRKKVTPKRATKQPPKRTNKREPRRGF